MLLLAYRHWYGDREAHRYYIYGDSLGKTGKNACIQGKVERLELKTASCQLYLKNVSVQFEQESTISVLSNLLVYLTKEPEVLPGYQVQVTGILSDFSQATNPGQFNAKEYYREKGIYYQMYGNTCVNVSKHSDPLKSTLQKTKRQMVTVIQNCLPQQEAGIVSTMLFGEKALLEPEIRQLYQQNGIGHLLAISGLHVTILCMGFYRFLLRLYFPRQIAIPITIGILYAYGTMTGFGISTSRAIIMMILYLLAELFGRSYDLLSALALSALLIILQRPFAVTSCSFLLSYLAMIGITLIYPLLQETILGNEDAKRERKRRLQRRKKECLANGGLHRIIWLGISGREALIQMLFMNVAIQITTLPVILWFYFEIPTYGVLLNLLLLPFSSILIILVAISSMVGLFSITVARFLFGSVYAILEFYEVMCHFFSELPYSISLIGKPEGCQLAGYVGITVTAILLYSFYQKRNLLFIIWTVATLVLIMPVPKRELSVTFLDVGQGDGIVIETADKTLLVDGGSTSEKQVGKDRIIPYLKSRGIRSVDYMIMTHADADHISGQQELLETSEQRDGIKIQCLLLPEPAGTCQKESGFQKMRKLAKKHHVPVKYIHTGDTYLSNDLEITCLHPNRGMEAKSANAYSTTLQLSIQGYYFLLCGDLEGEGEAQVLQYLQSKAPYCHIHYDVLKIAHHGSKNSTSDAFLHQTKPALSVISCGYQNRYGHPHKELLARLKNTGTQILQTQDAGAIRISVSNKKLQKQLFSDSPF